MGVEKDVREPGPLQLYAVLRFRIDRIGVPAGNQGESADALENALARERRCSEVQYLHGPPPEEGHRLLKEPL